MHMRLLMKDVGPVIRVIYLVIAATEGYLGIGAGAIGLAIGLHIAPAEPGPEGQLPEYGPWHASLDAIIYGLTLCLLGLPGTVGALAILIDSFPHRTIAIRVAGLGMMVVALFVGLAIASGWTLA